MAPQASEILHIAGLALDFAMPFLDYRNLIDTSTR